MGYMTTLGIQELDMDLKTQIEIHLVSNFYPPVPAWMAQTCVDAISAYLDDDSDRMIELPRKVTYKGSTSAPAWAIIEQHRLEPWLPHSDDCYCDECVPVGDSAEFPLENDL